jgi:hypothetical protein
MSYIGSTPTTQSFIAGTDSFNGNGSATNFTLSRSVNSTNDIQVVVNNVVQYPPNYSVSGNTLTISPAPSAGTNNVYVRYLSTTLQSITIPGGSTVVGNFGLSGNLQFLGSAQRITGDFSNATLANRVAFQTSTTNGVTTVAAIPNGTSTTSQFAAWNNSDQTNAAFFGMAMTNTDARLQTGINGSGTALPMTFLTGGSETARFSATAKTLILSGGDTTANGTGITFPATQSASSNANTLDDYEEGTYTPTITASGGGSPSGGGYTGIYTKIGRTVFTTISITSVSKNTLSGVIRISLPFPIANNANSTGCVRYGSFTTTAGTVLVVAQGFNADTYISLQQFSKDSYIDDIRATNLSTTVDFYNITYTYNTNT